MAFLRFPDVLPTLQDASDVHGTPEGQAFQMTSTYNNVAVAFNNHFYGQTLIIECGYHDDGGSKNIRNACALISDHLASTF
jgi:hypothetical protein